MDSNNIINYLPPAIFGLISFTFLLLWHLRIATSWQWGAGFAQTGMGFALVAFPISPTFDIFVSGMLYIGAAYCYGSAILLHFEAPMLRVQRRLLIAGYLVIHTFLVIGLESLKWELFLTDVAFACVLLLALCSVVKKSVGPADRVMMISGFLVVFDGLIRTTLFTFFIQSSDQMADFADSSYNLAVQFTTTTVGLLFPITGLAAMAAAAIRRHRDAAEKDPLTGLLNRRGFEVAVHGPITNTGLQGAVIVCDIDHFKGVNDSYGHAVGDKVIAELAEELRHSLGLKSAIARFGGEEFVAFLRNTSLTEAAVIAQAVRIRFAGRDWRHTGVDRQITASFGVSRIEDGEMTTLAAIDRADRALYAAKAAGRNQVVIADHGSECVEVVSNGENKTSPKAVQVLPSHSRASVA